MTADGPGQVAITGTANASTGLFIYTYVITASGTYRLTVNTNEGLLHSSSLMVQPGIVHPAASSIVMRPSIEA
ncbi:hypothetical protein TSOC_013664, partial [Tetrabaena socialis]